MIGDGVGTNSAEQMGGVVCISTFHLGTSGGFFKKCLSNGTILNIQQGPLECIGISGKLYILLKQKQTEKFHIKLGGPSYSPPRSTPQAKSLY